MSNPYAEAAKARCPRCKAKVGAACRERYMVCGNRECTYTACARWRDLSTPHPARLAHAALAAPSLSEPR